MVELEPGQELVKERPDDLVRIPLVEAARDLRRQLDGDGAVFLGPAREHLAALAVVDAGRITRPADPDTPRLLDQRTDRRGQSSRAPLGPPRVARPAERQGKTVRYTDHAIRHGGSVQ